MKVAVDSSVLVGLINPRDLWRDQALALREALLAIGAELLYFDCVAAEAVSAAVRRLHEKGRLPEVESLLHRLNTQVPAGVITWILPDVPDPYPAALDLIRSSSGALNFNDALIALACRERGIPAIASFDPDFEQVPWLRRLARPEDVIP
ncbi:MAG: PIN domain-containing protein [Anaerolineae bacterium]|nr:PIN domain-containing protein [Anaerolineae bacterium]